MGNFGAREKYDLFDGDWEFVGMPRVGALSGGRANRIFYVAASIDNEVGERPTVIILWRYEVSPFSSLKPLDGFLENPARLPRGRDVEDIMDRAGILPPVDA